MLHWMGIEGHHPDGCGPLVMNLVYVLVKGWVMEEPEEAKEHFSEKNRSTMDNSEGKAH